MKFYNSPDFLTDHFSDILNKNYGKVLLPLQLAFRDYLFRFINNQATFSQSYLHVCQPISSVSYDFYGFSVSSLQFVFEDKICLASDLSSNHLIVNSRMLSQNVLEAMYVLYFCNQFFVDAKFDSLETTELNLAGYNRNNLVQLIPDLAFENGFESVFGSTFELGQFVLNK